ncbi:hypothetical protein QH494_03855 [Sphingomonas sp. AR_OL41]|uniref:hypothetical protein n=1 Tax=Sphingomonas sp. AR_OL41 TaxID=3042729 RepID=UPI002480CED1|nr:hypothetical protein [Sphingomonas sp. AR_OL41]MDH7971305.1 hypothetical protein [Sphingomonas sp. AR_OL41]
MTRPTAFLTLIALVTCLISNAAEASRAREVTVSIPWSLTPSALANSSELDLRGNKTLKVGTAAPRNAFILLDDAQLEGGKIFIPKGVELAWANSSHEIACEPIRQEHHVYFRCLLDSDQNGTLDFALVVSATEAASWPTIESFEYLMGSFVALEPVGLTSLTKPISISEIKDTSSQLKVDVHFKGSAEKQRVRVVLCASRQGHQDVCTRARNIAINGTTGESDQFGFHIVAKVTADGPATITVTPTKKDLML